MAELYITSKELISTLKITDQELIDIEIFLILYQTMNGN